MAIKFHTYPDGTTVTTKEPVDIIAELRAENERLREVIRAFVRCVDSHPQDYELDTKEHGLSVCLNNRPGELLRAEVEDAKCR